MSSKNRSNYLSSIKKKIQNYYYSREFKKIEQKARKKYYTEALQELESLEREKKLDSINLLRIYLLRSKIYLDTNENEKGLKFANESFFKANNLNNNSFMVSSLAYKAKALLKLNKVDECIETIEEGEKIYNGMETNKQEELNNYRADFYSTKGMVFRRKDLNLALENFHNALTIQKNLRNLPEVAYLLNQIGIIHASRGELDQALDFLNSALDVHEELGDEEPTIKLFNNIGLLYSYKGDSEKALEYYQKSLDLSDKYGDTQISATLSANIGVLYSQMGELDRALNYSYRSLELYKDLKECKYEMATCLNAIGTILEEKGELNESLEAYINSLKLSEEIENKQGIATSFNNIANINKIRGDTDKAASDYQRSLELFEALESSIDISLTLNNLASLALERGHIKEAEEYLEKLKTINEREENKIIDQYYRITRALVLKSSDRVVQQAEAQKIFKEISEEEVVQHQITVDAMLYLCEILLAELRSSGDEEVLNEIKSILDRLMKIAKDQNSVRKLVNTQILQSRIAMLELDLNTTRSLLSEAQTLAEEKGLINVAMNISREYDSLLDQLSKWTDLVDQNVSMIEKLEMTELEDMITRIIRKREEIPEFSEEEPALFLLLSTSGKVLFSKQFVPESALNERVIGDVLTAINSFIQETFATTGMLERVKHKEHIILMKPTGSLLSCYVYKGPSYSALHKLDQFVEQIKEKRSIWNVVSPEKVEEISHIEQEIDELISKIFSSSPKEVKI